MSSRRILLSILKYAATLGVLYFVYEQVVKHWDDLSTFDWQIDIFPLILSLGFGLIAFYLFAIAWRLIIGTLGHTISINMSFKIAYLSNLGRYIPGKVWQVFGMLYLAGRQGVPAERATASFVIAQLFAIPASLLAFSIAAFLEPTLFSDRIALIGSGSIFLLLLFTISGSIILIVKPEPLFWLVNRLLVKFKREPVDLHLDKKVALLIFSSYFLGWVIYGVAFWLQLVAVAGYKAPNPIAAVGLFNLSYQIGYLALFAPGGFGPRELVIASMLAPFTGPISAALAIVARLWAIVLEAISAMIALAIRK